MRAAFAFPTIVTVADSAFTVVCVSRTSLDAMFTGRELTECTNPSDTALTALVGFYTMNTLPLPNVLMG